MKSCNILINGDRSFMVVTKWLRLLTLPVFHGETRNTGEFPGAMRYQCHVVGSGNGPDLQIARADRRTLACQESTDFAEMPRSLACERKARQP